MRRSLLAALPLLVTACSTTTDLAPIDAAKKDEGVEEEGDGDDVEHIEHLDDPRLDVSGAAHWRCVGAPGDDLLHTVLRLQLQFGDTLNDDVVATVTRAPQFLLHGLGDIESATPPPPEHWTFSVQTDAARTRAHLAGDGRVLTVHTAAHTGLATAVLNDGGVDVDLDCFDLPALQASLPASYDDEVGHCVDDHGDVARNTIPLAVVRETGFGECVDVGGEALNANDLGYPVLAGWNLRGAHLDTAGLSFASLIDADLRGTQLSQIAFGYAVITGTIDEATAPPAPCTVDGDQLACSQ
jgi:hypothetical protein